MFNVIWPLAFESLKLNPFVILLLHVLLIEEKVEVRLKLRFESFETCPRCETCPIVEVKLGLVSRFDGLFFDP